MCFYSPHPDTSVWASPSVPASCSFSTFSVQTSPIPIPSASQLQREQWSECMSHVLNHLQLPHSACEHKIPGKALSLSRYMIAELLKYEIILQQGENCFWPGSTSIRCWRHFCVKGNPHCGLVRKAMRSRPFSPVNKWGPARINRVSLKRANWLSFSIHRNNGCWDESSSHLKLMKKEEHDEVENHQHKSTAANTIPTRQREAKGIPSSLMSALWK